MSDNYYSGWSGKEQHGPCDDKINFVHERVNDMHIKADKTQQAIEIYLSELVDASKEHKHAIEGLVKILHTQDKALRKILDKTDSLDGANTFTSNQIINLNVKLNRLCDYFHLFDDTKGAVEDG